MKEPLKVHTCGAKTRSGGQCQKPPLLGKTRCRLHGGKSTGSPKGALNAMTHGIYSNLIHADELPLVEEIQSAAGKIENELLVARLQLRRALKAQAHAETLPDEMEVCETVEREGAEQSVAKYEVKKKLRDYPQLIDRLLARIESLEKTRHALLANKPQGSDDDLTREDTFIAPDGPIPANPIL